MAPNRAGMAGMLWARARVVAPAVVLAAVVAFLAWRLGTGPFVDGVRSVDGGALAAAAAIGALTTLCCAWRWRTVARALGVELSLGAAVAAYYRSLFINVTVPGGVVGDVHRGYSHGRDSGDVGRGLRAVAWERFAGQVVQIVLTVVVLLALPSPVQGAMPLVTLGLVVAVGALVLVARLRPAGASASLWTRVRGAVAADVRGALLAPGARVGIALASALIVAGHAATFLIAARTAGSTASISRMLPLALLAMMAMTLPNVGGWGPREGVTAWAFAAAGLGAGRGVTTSVAYGVMAIVAALPGAAVLLVAWFRSTRAAREGVDDPDLAQRPAPAARPERAARPDRPPRPEHPSLDHGAAHA
jgi:glycosyltransferase 2 family protein